MPTFTRITQITAFLATVATTVPACVDGNVIFTSTQGGEESGGEPGDSSSGQGATSTSGGSSGGSTGNTSSSTSESSTGEPLGCFESEIGDFDLLFSGCCEQPIGTCSAWCEQQGLGPCVFIGVYETEQCTDEGMYGGLCEVDPWVYFENDPPAGIRCACAFPG